MRFKFREKIYDFFRPPIKITFILADPFTESLCTDIQNTLRTKERIVTTKYTILGNFYNHRVKVRVHNRQKLKENINKLRKKHPNMAIELEPTSYVKHIWSLSTSIIAIILIVWKILELFQ